MPWAVLTVALGALCVKQEVPAQAQPVVHDLSRLTQLAERNYPGLRAASHKIAAAEAKLAEAWISPFFQFTATSLFSLVPDTRGHPLVSPDSQLPLTNPWGPLAQAQVEGAVPLWTFGKLESARLAARAGVRAATLERGQLLARLRTDVRRAYFALQLSLDTRQMISEGLGKLRRAVTLLEQRLDDEDPDASEIDRYRLGAALSEVQARASQAERLERASRAALALLTGLDEVRVPDCPLEPLPVPEQPSDWYIQRARAHRPEAGLLETAVQARQAQVKASRARYFPDLALTLRVSRSYAPGVTNQNNPFVIDPANYNALGGALVARWSLDLWGNRQRVENASRLLLQTRAQAQEALTGVAIQVAERHAALQDARRRLVAWKRAHKDGRKWFITAAQGYEIGTMDARELVDAARAYFTARFSHLQAIHDLNAGAAQLEQATAVSILDPGAWTQNCDW